MPGAAIQTNVILAELDGAVAVGAQPERQAPAPAPWAGGRDASGSRDAVAVGGERCRGRSHGYSPLRNFVRNDTKMVA
jgi:hypothetical protein